MISLNEKKDCCGCGACIQRCPKQCIILQQDTEGFLYPHVDETSCIDCSLCEVVCPISRPYDERNPLQIFAAVNKNEQIRMHSSSGGVFSLLSEKVIEEGGVVFGARFDEDWQVMLDYTETADGLAAFRGSKYVQARTEKSFSQCEHFLKEERKVLYSGAPCQIAGLKHFLRKEYDNLITVDFLCHGVPSPKVWSKYLDEVTKKKWGADFQKSAIKSINFRDKSIGWKSYRFVISHNKFTTKINECFQDNSYMQAFLSDLILRPSCYTCPARLGKSHSDITIADFWGIEKRHPEIDDNKGTSLLFVNTKKGRDNIPFSDISFVETSFDGLVHLNGGMKKVTEIHPKRDRFFCELERTKSVSRLIDKIVCPPLNIRIKVALWRIINSIIK